jgi:glycosyltransferase involved in cell wall biosynthesis
MSEYKGLEYIIKALEILKTSVPITILTFNERGHFNRFLGKHHIIELGWLEDEEETIDAYQASDIFVMPSVAEAFGMMAMEAMACEKPVITFDGTSLPEVIFAPEGGISVPARDVDALASAMCDLIENPEKRIKIGIRARKLAMQHYDINQQIKRTLEVYEEVLNRQSLKEDKKTSSNALHSEG